MSALFEFLLRQGDNALVLGHRTSEWCGTAPVLEEDIALANTALDLIGQTQLWLSYAAEVEGKGRSANDLAFLRDAYDFRNVLMVETPNENFGRTLMRQFLFDAFQVPWLTVLSDSKDKRVSDIAIKSLKEAQYHLERSNEIVVALGDGTEESNVKMQAALDYLWPYARENMLVDSIDEEMENIGIAVLPSSISNEWSKTVENAMRDAFLKIPDSDFVHKGGRTGTRHTEHLGHMLSTMQVLQRSYPGAIW